MALKTADGATCPGVRISPPPQKQGGNGTGQARPRRPDFTWVTELAVTIAGQVFVHMLCVFVLPYSNWRWATVCLSESIASIRHG